MFDAMYSEGGRHSVPPERLLKGSLLMALYTIRSERMFCEQLGCNLLFRWFLDMDMAEAPFDHSTFSKNRERLIEHDVALQFFFEGLHRRPRTQFAGYLVGCTYNLMRMSRLLAAAT